MLISYMIVLMVMMIGVSYFVLLERKVLSSIHLRMGPGKVGLLGLLQPLADGGKLFMKGFSYSLIKGDMWIFLFSPMLGLILCYLMWSLFEVKFDEMDFRMGLLLFLCVSAVNVYVIVMGGWSSNSVYGIIGSCRGVAQSISYEVVMALLLLGVVMFTGNFGLKGFYYEEGLMGLCLVTFYVWCSVLLAETNRSPYDFVEGESELVSGFNVEYSSIGFSLFFLGEYGSMMFSSYLSGLMFLGNGGGSLLSMIMIFGYIWIRGIVPRFRYDKLMMMAWKYYLFYGLSVFIFFKGIMGFMMVIMCSL